MVEKTCFTIPDEWSSIKPIRIFPHNLSLCSAFRACLYMCSKKTNDDQTMQDLFLVICSLFTIAQQFILEYFKLNSNLKAVGAEKSLKAHFSAIW